MSDALKSISDILEAVEEYFACKKDESLWAVGSRSDDAARASTAYLARVRFGYPAKSAAKALTRHARQQ